MLATLDLKGQYAELYNQYVSYLNAADQDMGACLLMVSQMVSNSHEGCLDDLYGAEKWLRGRHSSFFQRRHACCENNIGIEHLMSGEFPQAIRHLQIADSELGDCSPLERHFAQNNLGLYYMLCDGERDYERAFDYFEKARHGALSPLQKAYASMNIAKLYQLMDMPEDSDAASQFAQQIIAHTPDPAAIGTIAFNAYHLYYELDVEHPIVNEKQMLLGLKKDQNALLIRQRQELATRLNLSLSFPEGNQRTDRRTFFATLNWNPCELMFYC